MTLEGTQVELKIRDSVNKFNFRSALQESYSIEEPIHNKI